VLWLGRARYALSESGDSGWAEQGMLSCDSGESADSGWVEQNALSG